MRPISETAVKRSGEIKSLTGLRGFAAIWVVLFHFQYAMGPVADFFFKVFDNRFVIKGSLAVDLFFVLSGFVLAYAAQEWRGEKPVAYTLRFLRARLARIYPLHIASMLMMCLVIDLRAPGLALGRAVMSQLTLTTAWGEFHSPEFNYPSWSLSAEWAAYLAFPVLLFANRFFARRSVALAASALIAAACLVFLGAKYNNGKCDFTWDFGWARCLSEFWIGLCVFQAYKFWNPLLSARARNLWAVFAAAGFIAHVIFAGIDGWIIPVATLLVFATSLEPAIFKKIFANRVSHHVGEISFSVYMLHVPVGITLLKFTMEYPRLYANVVSGIATVAMVILALLIASDLTYRYFEMPMKRWLSDARPARAIETVERSDEKLAS